MKHNHSEKPQKIFFDEFLKPSGVRHLEGFSIHKYEAEHSELKYHVEH